MSLKVSNPEKINLSLSNRDLQIFLYNDSRNSLFKNPSLSSRSSLGSERVIDSENSPLKKSKEY